MIMVNLWRMYDFSLDYCSILALLAILAVSNRSDFYIGVCLGGDRFQSESARAIGMINSLVIWVRLARSSLNLIPLFGLPKVYSSLGLIFIAAILSILKV